MTLLEFARGPALQWSTIILVLGLILRIAGAWLLAHDKDYSRPRVDAAWRGGLRAVFSRFWPHQPFVRQTWFHILAGYVLHIGLFVVVFLYAPHIAFIRDLTGLNWPGLPANLVLFVGALTAASLVAFFVRRLVHPVMRTISTLDDYLSNLITLAPLVTGILAYAHFGGRYETLLAIHLLSVSLLFVWIPLSKLAHVITFIPSRFQLGAWLGRRGVKA
ncbi:MAG: nitrate reductase [Chromatiaceae bacterium]|nr:nitrate reductase [Chromatiaceae bacterium]